MDVNRLELLRLFLIVVFFGASPASAHHILGLPHYSYKENYPQVPTLEYPAETGPYEILLTSYPGKPTAGEAANLAIYVKNRNTDAAYEKPLTIRVLRTFTFGANEEVLPPTEVVPYQQPHELTVVFPYDGEYIVEMSMDVEGRTEVLPFLMIIGDPSATMSVLIAVVVGLAIFVIVIRAIKIKQNRRRKEVA